MHFCRRQKLSFPQFAWIVLRYFLIVFETISIPCMEQMHGKNDIQIFTHGITWAVNTGGRTIG